MTKLLNPGLDVSTDEVFNDFKKHFDFIPNEKIIFSAKYGMGKSFFLNKFFENEDVKNRYSIITLSPINYSVSNNEDIFELIKFDIIRHLFLSNILTFTKGDISFDKLTVVKEYLKKLKSHPYKIGKQLVSGISKIGESVPSPEYSAAFKVVSESTKTVFEIVDDFLKFEKTLNKKHKPIEKEAEEFGEDMQNKIGSYIEFNFISALIKEVLEKHKTKSTRKNVLIIEDFDRLDPAHIFRILNIFSAHNHDQGNKFGFDKIIIVCDLQNIKSLYKHLYGEKIDFNGYIDKFYSIEPYYFDNNKSMFFYLKNKLQLNFPDYVIKSIVELIVLFSKIEDVRVRKLYKAFIVPVEEENKIIINYEYKKNIDFHHSLVTPRFIDDNVENLFLFSSDFPVFDVIKFLSAIYGGIENFVLVLDEYQKNYNERLDAQTSGNFARLLGFANLLNEPDSVPKLFFQGVGQFEYPAVDYLSVKLRIITSWNTKNKYSEDLSFYKDSRCLILAEGLIDSRPLVASLKRLVGVAKEKGLI
jgi:hypothetical protein